MNQRDGEILVQIGRNLAGERTRAGLTQEQVAARIGIQVQQYQRMERRHSPQDTGITKYVHAARAIGVEYAELFRGVDALLD